MPLDDIDMPRDEQAWRDYVAARLREGDAQMQAMRNTIDDVKQNTKDIVDIFNAVRGGFRVLGWLGSLLKWLVIVGAPLGTAWLVIKGWVAPGEVKVK